MKNLAFLFTLALMVCQTAVSQAQKSFSFQLGLQAGYDLVKLDDRYIADPNLTFPTSGSGISRFHVLNPVGFQAYVNWKLNKGPIVQSGFEMVKRKITYFGAFSATKFCTICDLGVDMPMYSVPANLIIRLNPKTDPENWEASIKAGLSLQWSGKTDNVFRFSGSSKLETPNKVSVEEVADDQYRMFLIVDEAYGIGGQFGFVLTKNMGDAGSVGIEGGFRTQFDNTTSIQVWGYDKDTDSRINGYNPYSFKFASLYLGINYGLPWGIGPKAD
ncbi:MAG: hypothetical protein IT258_07560 [Saprospiraceae bacterium]|nr:hypothetical protein [Saprospiraceae bacterium]